MKSFYILLIALSGGYLTAQLFAWLFFEKVFFPDGGELFERRKNKAEWQTVFPKNMLLLIIFVFSASLIGLLTYIAGVAGWVSMLMGAVGGLAINFLINTVIAPLFFRANHEGAPKDDELSGLSAVVTEDIDEDDYGTIRVRRKSRDYLFRCASANGRALPKGCKVVVLYAQDGLCFAESEEHLCDVLFEEDAQ
ncbi:MAG: hypothetical protein KIG62_02565 [Oscillospiraceae bacterium]|nr:hypothetical protein [Oscillospiraceae bacterium]